MAVREVSAEELAQLSYGRALAPVALEGTYAALEPRRHGRGPAA